MDRRVVSLCLSVSFILLFAGCSGKRVSSSEGDQVSKTGQGKSEEILPDAIKPIPPERSFDRPPGSLPSNLSPMSSAVSSSNALGDIFFDFDQFQLRKDALPVLDANAGWLRVNGNETVLIEGHCDERGTLAYNLVLGEKRARAAKKYLQNSGVRISQLQIISYGETRPFCKQQNENCYQQNRRAHFVTQ
ncbi:MAG: peptidoglycan-associated lipoprotein Pal [Nitrospirae bacterium]|nr:peptidoglycan-associated lipoprotein Pal [Nitrospirota bacterium]